MPVGWTLTDLRSPPTEAEPEPEAIDESESVPSFEPELVLIDDRSNGSQDADEASEVDMQEVVGEVPPLLSRAFRAAGLD